MRRLLLILLLGCSVGLWAQNSSQSNPTQSGSAQSNSEQPSPEPSNAQKPESTSGPDSKPVPRNPNLEPPRSDRVNVDDLGDAEGQSSSKDTQIDLSPPPNDAKTPPHNSDVPANATGTGNADVNEFHPWDPHKAAKDVEVGDFYFKRKNYRAAEDRYREALYYKDNDAIATYRLAVCLEKMNRPEEARAEFESYLRILPNGPQAADAKKAIERLKRSESNSKAAK